MNEITIKDMTKEQLLELQEQVNKQLAEPERKPLVFMPAIGEKYWMAYTRGEVGGEINAHDDFDISVTEIGGAHRTQEEAFEELARRTALVKLKSWIDENDSERGGRFIAGETNYSICYDVEEDELNYSVAWGVVYTTLPYFSSEQKVKQCIKDIGDNIKCLFTQFV